MSQIDIGKLELKASNFLQARRFPQACEALTEAIEIARDHNMPIEAAHLHSLLLEIRSKHE